jgi:hypothetical protein
MLVLKVNVEEIDGRLQVTCPDAPAVRHSIGSLWDACAARHVLAEHVGAPSDLVWLQIRSQTGAVTVISDVHPLHWIAFHSVISPSSSGSDGLDLVFDHALTALRHEADQAHEQGRLHAQVKLILSFADGAKEPLPRYGGFLLGEVVEGTRDTDDLGAWVRTRLAGLLTHEGRWYKPVVGIQVGIFGPDAPTIHRYR